MKTYKGLITEINKNQIFIFGSNYQGRHGKGSAKFALDKCGAIYGKAYGIQGNSYAIVTKDLTKYKHPSVETWRIMEQIKDLYDFALENSNLEFIVAYSGKGKNLNGYSNKEMARMFSSFIIPDNIVFEEDFSKLLTII